MSYVNWEYIGNASLRNPVTQEIRTFSRIDKSLWRLREALNIEPNGFVADDIYLPVLADGDTFTASLVGTPTATQIFKTGLSTSSTWYTTFFLSAPTKWDGDNRLSLIETNSSTVNTIISTTWHFELKSSWKGDAVSATITGGASSTARYFISTKGVIGPESGTSSDLSVLGVVGKANYNVYTSDKSYMVNVLCIPEDKLNIIDDVDKVIKYLSYLFWYNDGGDYSNSATRPFNLTIYGADGYNLESQVIAPAKSIAIGVVSTDIVNVTYSNYLNDSTFDIPIARAGYTLAGFSTKQGALKAEFPVGSTTSVDWDGSEPITLYPVYTKQLIPPTPSNTFSVTFYNNKAEANRVDKTGYITAYAPISGTLKEKTSIINPTITFAMSNVPEVNYAYIPVFNRYYFIENISSVRNGLWEISFKCDVLMSYKDKILEQTALVARNENDYSMRLRDDKLICGSRPHIYTVPFTKGTGVDIGLIQDSSTISQDTPFFVLTTFGKG